MHYDIIIKNKTKQKPTIPTNLNNFQRENMPMILLTLFFNYYPSSFNFRWKCFSGYQRLLDTSSGIRHPSTNVPVRPLKTLLWTRKLFRKYVFAPYVWKGLTSGMKGAVGCSLNDAVYTFLHFVVYLFLSLDCFQLILIS